MEVKNETYQKFYHKPLETKRLKEVKVYFIILIVIVILMFVIDLLVYSFFGTHIFFDPEKQKLANICFHSIY